MSKKLVLKDSVKEHLRALMSSADEETINQKFKFEENYLTLRYEEFQKNLCKYIDVFCYFSIREGHSKLGLEYLVKLSLKDCDIEETE